MVFITLCEKRLIFLGSEGFEIVTAGVLPDDCCSVSVLAAAAAPPLTADVVEAAVGVSADPEAVRSSLRFSAKGNRERES